MKKIILILVLFSSLSLLAQRGNRDGNRIGISGGITNTNLFTSNFNVKPANGWMGGFSVRGNYYNDWSMVFGMQFMENNFEVETVSPLLQVQNVNYKMSGVQIRLLLSANLVKNHFSIDFGPVLQVNDKLKIDSKYENNFVSNSLLTAKDITDVTKINGNLYGGISAGGKRVRFIASYQLGVNNFLNNLNKTEELRFKNNNRDFKGHLGMLSGQLLFNL